MAAKAEPDTIARAKRAFVFFAAALAEVAPDTQVRAREGVGSFEITFVVRAPRAGKRTPHEGKPPPNGKRRRGSKRSDDSPTP